MKNVYLVLFITFFTTSISAQSISTFEELDLPVDTFLNDARELSSYSSGEAFFPNVYNPDFGGYWESGWGISTSRNDSLGDFSNLSGAITGGGFESTTYAVGQQNAIINLSGNSLGKVVDGLYLTNGTYPYHSMKDGDDFAKKFGGTDGSEPDFFKIEIKKYSNGILHDNVIEFYLADFRFENDSLDYIVNDWQWVDLSSLGNVDSLQFTLVSTDIGDYGINTPLFFCLDNLTISALQIDIPTDENISTFEENNLATNTFLNGSEGVDGYQSGNAFFPTTYAVDYGGYWANGWAVSAVQDSVTSGFGNLYGAKTKNGLNSFTYAVGQQNSMIKLTGDATGKIVNGLYVTNSTYTHNSMRDGDDFAKKFGGTDGTDPDFLKLEIRKYSNGKLQDNVVDFYLADFRSEDGAEDYIINDWQWIDLTSLGNVDSLQFTLVSTDLGDYGINTPLFFCIDNLEISNDLSTSLEDLTLEHAQITLFPNPTVDYLKIELANKDLTGQAGIFDLTGRQILTQNIAFDNNQINVTNLESGVYIFALQAENGVTLSTTFVKK